MMAMGQYWCSSRAMSDDITAMLERDFSNARKLTLEEFSQAMQGHDCEKKICPQWGEI